MSGVEGSKRPRGLTVVLPFNGVGAALPALFIARFQVDVSLFRSFSCLIHCYLLVIAVRACVRDRGRLQPSHEREFW
jgi:hypothetical protein